MSHGFYTRAVNPCPTHQRACHIGACTCTWEGTHQPTDDKASIESIDHVRRVDGRLTLSAEIRRRIGQLDADAHAADARNERTTARLMRAEAERLRGRLP